MIKKKVVEEFRKRKLDDFSWMKTLTTDELDEDLPCFVKDYAFTTDPYDCQKVGTILGTCFKEFLFLLDMGLGKSKIISDTFAARRSYEDVGRCLIVAPNESSVDGWLEEIVTHTPQQTAIGLFGSTEERLDTLYENLDNDNVVLTYSAIMHLLSTKQKTKKGKMKLTPDPKKIREFLKLFNGVVFDEIHQTKNKLALTFRLCNRIARKCDYVYGLTGTPMGRDPQDLWAQFYLVDGGLTFGKTLGLYREAFFKAKDNYFGGSTYTLDKQYEKQLSVVMHNRSIQYSDTECGDIPKEKRITFHLPFPQTNYDYYKDTLKTLQKARGDYNEMENAFIRMRQISSGFVGFKGKDGDKVEMKFPYSPKLEKLEELVLGLPQNRKMVIFHEFICSGTMICDMLTRLKIPHLNFKKLKRDAISKFKKDPKYTVLVINSKSGNSSHNLQVANYLTFFESPVSPIIRKQAERRCTGARQKNFSKVFIFDLVTKNSVDQDVLNFIAEGKSMFKAIVQGKVDGF